MKTKYEGLIVVIVIARIFMLTAALTCLWAAVVFAASEILEVELLVVMGLSTILTGLLTFWMVDRNIEIIPKRIHSMIENWIFK